jgi:hypothetical protein
VGLAREPAAEAAPEENPTVPVELAKGNGKPAKKRR